MCVKLLLRLFQRRRKFVEPLSVSGKSRALGTKLIAVSIMLCRLCVARFPVVPQGQEVSFVVLSRLADGRRLEIESVLLPLHEVRQSVELRPVVGQFRAIGAKPRVFVSKCSRFSVELFLVRSQCREPRVALFSVLSDSRPLCLEFLFLPLQPLIQSVEPGPFVDEDGAVSRQSLNFSSVCCRLSVELFLRLSQDREVRLVLLFRALERCREQIKPFSGIVEGNAVCTELFPVSSKCGDLGLDGFSFRPQCGTVRIVLFPVLASRGGLSVDLILFAGQLDRPGLACFPFLAQGRPIRRDLFEVLLNGGRLGGESLFVVLKDEPLAVDDSTEFMVAGDFFLFGSQR